MGGRIFIRLSGEGKRVLHEAIHDVCKNDLWAPYFNNYLAPWAFQNVEEFGAILKEIGFENIRIQDATKTVSFNGNFKFSEWLSSWVPHRHRLPLGLWESFFMDVANAYCGKLGLAKDDDIPITMPGLLVEANR